MALWRSVLFAEIFEQGWEATDFLRDHTEAPLLIKEDGMFLRMSDLGVEPTETTTNAQGQEIPVDPYVVWDEASSSAVPLAQATKPRAWRRGSDRGHRGAHRNGDDSGSC